ncbi:unnamed protein product [Cylindrotheca closterium]|uniref:Uncharacterized protein n=1 Tax=Cylindrotheca closterium TaxID=2856 RepID=A0AAD2G8K9_9STRA|nr:unnamed protein product [Cylindrotheca closterium]
MRLGKISIQRSPNLLLVILCASNALARTTSNPAFLRPNVPSSSFDTFEVVSLAAISMCTNSIPLCLLVLRGGERYHDGGDDEEYDIDGGYSEEEDDEYNQFSKRRQSPPPPVSSRRPPGSRGPPPANLSGRPRRSSKKSMPWAQRIASQSLQMGSQLAWNAVKTPGKLAYHVIRPKHVDLAETGGLWRMDQQVTIRGDKELASVATVELDARRKLIIVRHRPIASEDNKASAKENDKDKQGEDDKEAKEVVVRQPYTFKKSRLGSYKTSFVAPAFLVGDKPRMYGYKGNWQRKMADKKVIKLVGKIYEVRRQRFGKDRGSYQFAGKPVGTFVARRRVQLIEEDEYDDDDDDYFVDFDDEAEDDYDEEDYDEEMYD